MKRSGPLRRVTPLRSNSTLSTSTPIKQVSARRRKRDANYPDARDAVFERAQGRCEALVSASCSGRCEQVHHKRGRGGDDPHDLGNLLGVCAPCHEWVETNRAEAYRLGFLVRRNSR